MIGICDRIFTRIRSVETSVSPRSSFALDISQVNRMLANRTKRSLCLVDEFGKNTSPSDGVALLATCVEYFAGNSAKALFVMHFPEILDIMDTKNMAAILLFQMETMQVPSDSRHGETELVPLFRLTEGLSKGSEGIQFALQAGLPRIVIERAKEIKDCMVNKTPLRPLIEIGDGECTDDDGDPSLDTKNMTDTHIDYLFAFLTETS